MGFYIDILENDSLFVGVKVALLDGEVKVRILCKGLISLNTVGWCNGSMPGS